MKTREDLAKAVEAWAEVDSEVADSGWTKENECRWDDAKDKMVSLADEIQNQPCKCVVVSIREIGPTHCDDVGTIVFSSWEKANAWIVSDIDSHVQIFGLDRESAVDGWCVKIDSSGHTIEYDAKERVVQ